MGDVSTEIIAIASGKGGTGKTLIAASLGYARSLVEQVSQPRRSTGRDMRQEPGAQQRADPPDQQRSSSRS